ncbi:hypothetical protein BDR26DRAFT_920410, partial [Obelidium mucronatum]
MAFNPTLSQQNVFINELQVSGITAAQCDVFFGIAQMQPLPAHTNSVEAKREALINHISDSTAVHAPDQDGNYYFLFAQGAPPTPRYFRNLAIPPVSTTGQNESRNTSKDVELGAVGVAGAEGAVRKAEEAVEFAVGVVKEVSLRFEKWRNSKQGDLTGSEPTYLLFKEELDSARAQLKEDRAALDGARAGLDKARAYHLNLITAGRLKTLIPRPESVFSDDRWQHLVENNPGLELSESEFLKSLLDDRYVEVKSIHELPIANPLIGCITSYTDPITKVQVICLPQPLPSPTMIGSHIIFVRPFNITMMNAMLACQTDRIIVVGNAGIGKSYMQLLILLWWARRDLRPEEANWDSFFDQIQVVARLERGRRTDLFFKRDKKHYTMNSRNLLPGLDSFDSKSTLFLYEPLASTDEIADCGADGCLWATVSPLPKRYKEFSKTNCALKYMECASEDELTFMARVLALGIPESSSLAPLYEPHAVLERIRVFGPFQRVVLPSSREGLDVQMQGRLSALDSLSAELLLKTRNISEEGSTSQLSISHHILRISPADSELGTYTLKASSEQVTELLSDRLYETELSNMKHRLSCYNDDPDSQTITPATKGSISTVLESFFAKNAVSNDNTKFLGWEVSKTKFSDDPDNKGWKPEWGPFSMNLDKMERSKNPPTFQEIVNSP